MTSAEVRQAVACFLTPQEVADLAVAALAHRPLGPVLADIRAGYRGYAAAGVICTATPAGLDVEILDDTIPAGLRAGTVRWQHVGQVVADAATPARLAVLNTALTDEGPSAGHAAAEALVLAGPAVTQLDLLDALASLGAVDDSAEHDPPESASDTAHRRGPKRAARSPRRATPTTAASDATGDA